MHVAGGFGVKLRDFAECGLSDDEETAAWCRDWNGILPNDHHGEHGQDRRVHNVDLQTVRPFLGFFH